MLQNKQRSLRGKLRVGLGLSLLVLFISSMASYQSITSLIRSADLVHHSNEVITGLEEIISTLKDAETGQRGYLLTGETVFLDPYSGAKQRAITLMQNIGYLTKDNPLQQKQIAKLDEIITGRLDVLEKTIKIKERGGNVSVSELLNGKTYMDSARAVISSMEKEEKRLLEERTASMNKLSKFTPMLIILAALIAILITIFFYRKVIFDFNERLKLEEELRKKNEDIDRRIDEIRHIAGQISNGDYDVRADEAVQDGLGGVALSLNAMAESLKYSFSLLGDKEWLQSGIASLNDQMVGEKSVPELANDVLEIIVAHTNSHVAAFYLLEEESHLELIAGYALLERERQQILRLGEGLAGQVWKSAKQILINDIPDEELTISYAAGNTKPRNVVAVPVFRHNELVGVLELGSLNTYSPLQLDFINTISTNIGIAIHVSQNRKKLQEFLEETQAQAEELQAQHSELEGLNAELEAQTQKIQTSEEELRVQQEELLQSNQELEERTSLLEEKIN